jgi:RNA polymerase sigma factor (sigma-70 family)
MPTSPLNMVIQHFLADFGPDGGGITDGELLVRFLRSRDDDALAAVVRRHAPMVWSVCCRLLHSHHDAEDAFQATFLVLVRKAADVPRQAVANWLYGVARQTAVRLRATAAKRGRRETQVVTMPEPSVTEAHDADLQIVVDEELSRLPEHYRSVILLCELEGVTRKEAARQLGIPNGSVASRLARARVLLAKRLTQRGVVFSGGSVAAVLSAGAASASAPPALVASTIKAACLLAAGKVTAAGVTSVKVAALTEGVVKTMFVTKIKSVLTVVLVVAALIGATGLIYQTQAAEQPMAKVEPPVAPQNQKTSEEKQAQPKPQPAKSDQERMVGNWFIMNEDSGRKGEMWAIDEDRILMHAKDLTPITKRYVHHLDTGKDPKHIDITVTQVNGSPVGAIKGIYALDGDELRLCLAALGKDRPAAFPEKPGPGEVLILQRETSGASPPKAKGENPAKSDRERMVGNWFIMNEDSGRKGEMWVIYEDWILMHAKDGGANAHHYSHRLDAAKSPKQIDISATFVNGSTPFKIMKGIYVLDGDELRLCLGGVNQDRPAAFPEKPGAGEVLILQRNPMGTWPPQSKEEKLQALIDQVLAAHGGEDKLKKLQFTMTVKHSNGETQQYFVQPPMNFRWETTYRDRTGKHIGILTHGWREWTKEPNEDAKELFPLAQLGTQPPREPQIDHLRFVGPRQVLRLKDTNHHVTLLDEEAKIDGRAAVAVEVTGLLVFKGKMYFDKETHLLLKSGSVTYSDYKKFDGIPVAQKLNDGSLMSQVIGFRAVEKFDAKLFEQP